MNKFTVLLCLIPYLQAAPNLVDTLVGYQSITNDDGYNGYEQAPYTVKQNYGVINDRIKLLVIFNIKNHCFRVMRLETILQLSGCVQRKLLNLKWTTLLLLMTGLSLEC